MAYTDPRAVFGVHTFIPYNRTTYLPYGLVRVAGGGEVNLTANRVDLNGGSNRFPWISEATTIDSEFTFTVREYPDFLFELFLGATATTTAAEAAGAVTALTNQVGTSCFNATTGCASIQVDTAADLKYGRYLIIVTDADDDKVDVYAHTDIDRTKGTDLTTYTDLMKITATELVVPGSSSTVAIPGTGMSIVGGSGTVAMTLADSCYFDVNPIHTGKSVLKVGAAGSTFIDFGARMIAAKLSDGRIFELHAWKANGAGLPIGLTENEFSEAELSMKLMYDSAQDAVFEAIALDGS